MPSHVRECARWSVAPAPVFAFAESFIHRSGVALSSFTHGGEQLDLLDASRREKLECLAQATDALRDGFGFSKIQFGGSMTKAHNEKEE